MAKFTFETDDPVEARSLLDALENRAAPIVETVVDMGTARAVVAPNVIPAGQAPLAHVPVPGDGPVVAPTEALRDANGMTWDETIHASTKAFKDDGTWKVRKGSADAAKAAIASHKAAGLGTDGNPVAPTTIAEQAATAPASPSGLPTGLPAVRADMSPPVTQDLLENKLMGMMSRGLFTEENGQYAALLTKHGVNLAEPSVALATNETLRAAVYASCMELEPGQA